MADQRETILQQGFDFMVFKKWVCTLSITSLSVLYILSYLCHFTTRLILILCFLCSYEYIIQYNFCFNLYIAYNIIYWDTNVNYSENHKCLGPKLAKLTHCDNRSIVWYTVIITCIKYYNQDRKTIIYLFL